MTYILGLLHTLIHANRLKTYHTLEEPVSQQSNNDRSECIISKPTSSEFLFKEPGKEIQYSNLGSEVK